MGKSALLLLIFLIGVVVLIFFGINWYKEQKKDPYTTFIKPRVELANFQIKTMTRQKTEMNMNMLIDNPSPIGFKINNLKYKIYIVDTEVMKSTYSKAIKLEGNDSSLISLPVTVYNEKLIRKLEELENKNLDSVNYKIKGQFFTNIPFLKGEPIDFEMEKRLPLYKIPKAKFEKLKIEKLGLNNTKVIIQTKIENPNVFPFKFKETIFKVNIDKDELMKGNIDTVVNIPAKGKVDLNLPAEISIKEVGETAFEMLLKPGDVDYSFYLETKLVSEDNSLKNSLITMEGQGKLQDLTKQNK
ncbi:MAG TPA: LEA type 2 family protein [Cytophagales bacterium]|nr:LEA type 2 family protein [Cytophagales bacterium]